MHALMADEEAEIEQLLVENRRKQCELRDEEAALTCQLDQLRSARQATAHAERAAAAARVAQTDWSGPFEWDGAVMELLHRFGHDTFRPLQREVINATLARHDVFAILPTGSGKSLLFQCAADTHSSVRARSRPRKASHQPPTWSSCCVPFAGCLACSR